MKKYLLGVAILLAIVVSAMGWDKLINGGVSNSPVTTAASVVQPVTMTGTWNQKSGMAGVDMSASITDGHISIRMESEVVSGTYYAGSFESDAGGTVFHSSVTDDPMLSQDKTKTFTYHDGVLSFPFTMQGKSVTVDLVRSSG